MIKIKDHAISNAYNRNAEMRRENSIVVFLTPDLCESGSIKPDSHMSVETAIKKAGVNICGAL